MQKQYVIQKLINNNVVFSIDTNGKEIILFGKAIGFNKKRGDIIPAEKIIKIFQIADSKQTNYLSNLVETIDPIYIDIAAKIIELFESKLKVKVSDIMIVSLSYHLANATENKKEGLEVGLDILQEIKSIYPQEFSIALKGLNFIYERLQIALSEDEAGYVVLHYLNSVDGGHSTETKERMKFQKMILDIIEKFYHVSIERDTLYYTRFLTHLSFLYMRLYSNQKLCDKTLTVFQIIKKDFPDLAECVECCSTAIEENFNSKISDEEKGYLGIHIKNMLSIMNKEGDYNNEGNHR